MVKHFLLIYFQLNMAAFELLTTKCSKLIPSSKIHSVIFRTFFVTPFLISPENLCLSHVCFTKYHTFNKTIKF